MPFIFPNVSDISTEEDEQQTPVLEDLPEAEELQSEVENVSKDSEAEETETDEQSKLPEALDYASVQAEALLKDAREQAKKIMEQARREAEKVYNDAKDAGRQDGYAAGVAEALEVSARKQEEQAAQLAEEIHRFIERANAALDKQLDDNMDDLRDLAIAIAEKVICVSLKSSTEIIGRMVQTALDKRKQREWVRIYIAECDARRMAQMPAALMSAITSLSDRVRIVPMADDESGTCVIEMPEEIVDASVSTQLNNVRELLMNTHQGDGGLGLGGFNF